MPSKHQWRAKNFPHLRECKNEEADSGVSKRWLSWRHWWQVGYTKPWYMLSRANTFPTMSALATFGGLQRTDQGENAAGSNHVKYHVSTKHLWAQHLVKKIVGIKPARSLVICPNWQICFYKLDVVAVETSSLHIHWVCCTTIFHIIFKIRTKQL